MRASLQVNNCVASLSAIIIGGMVIIPSTLALSVFLWALFLCVGRADRKFVRPCVMCRGWYMIILPHRTFCPQTLTAPPPSLAVPAPCVAFLSSVVLIYRSAADGAAPQEAGRKAGLDGHGDSAPRSLSSRALHVPGMTS